MKIIVAITGASGAIYAKQLLDELIKIPDLIVGVVMSENAKVVWELELENPSYNEYKNYTFYDTKDFNAPFASGSAAYDAMIVVPCSMGALGRMANGISENLISRAADVMLKERKKLILVTREMPLNLIHIENMKSITLAGGIICPAAPSFYSRPKTVEALANTVVSRIMNLINLPINTFRWNGE